MSWYSISGWVALLIIGMIGAGVLIARYALNSPQGKSELAVLRQQNQYLRKRDIERVVELAKLRADNASLLAALDAKPEAAPDTSMIQCMCGERVPVINGEVSWHTRANGFLCGNSGLRVMLITGKEQA